MQNQVTAIADTAKALADAAAPWTHNGWDSIIQGNGPLISMVGIIIVFSALTLLSFLIRAVSRMTKIKTSKPKSELAAQTETPDEKNGISGELVAAISLAIHEYLYELHDEEKTIITIQKISKPYSPWSSKLHNMTRPPHHITNRG